jgi:hypothetical protein
MKIVCDRRTRRLFWPAKKLVVRAQSRIVIAVQEHVELAGVVAQLVERLVRNQQVRGSNPLGSTILCPEPALGGFERRMVSSIALAQEDFTVMSSELRMAGHSRQFCRCFTPRQAAATAIPQIHILQ